MKCKMTAKVRVNPTEDLDKVIAAISNILKYDEVEVNDEYVVFIGGNDSLIPLRDSLKERKIRDTAERMFIIGAEKGKITFSLSKQAAVVSIPNIIDREMSVLGEINVTIETDNEISFIEWMIQK